LGIRFYSFCDCHARVTIFFFESIYIRVKISIILFRFALLYIKNNVSNNLTEKIIQKHLRFEIDNKGSVFLDLSEIFLFTPKASENLSM